MLLHLKKYSTPILIALLFIGLFFSRALLSISTVLFFATQLILHYHQYNSSTLKKHLPNLVISAVFFIALLTGLYSANTSEWWNRTVVKLPILLFGVAFISLRLTSLQVFTLHQLFLFLVLGGTMYSCGTYYLHSYEINTNYQLAKVLPTLIDNDHIRFSWCVHIAIIICLMLHSEINKKHLQIFNACLGIWLFIFQHILGSKTGLLMSYISVFIYLFFFAKKIKLHYKIITAIFFIATPIVAYFTITSFYNRVNYIKYDLQQISKSNYASGLSDATRILSAKAGLFTTAKHPLLGTGYGDVAADSKQWYLQNHPQLQAYEHILPTSQFLMVSAGAGGVAFLLFLFSLFFPFKITNGSVGFYLFYPVALLSFVWEIHLEGQNGVFIFGFFTLWFLYLANKNKLYAA